MIENNLHAKALSNGNWERAIVQSAKNVISPFVEIAYGIRAKTIPIALCCGWGCLMAALCLKRYDLTLFRRLGIYKLYPIHFYPRLVYDLCISLSGFWLWGGYQTALKHRLIRRLTESFTCAGLVNPMGRLPGFVFDRPIDGSTRKLRITRAAHPIAAFEKAKASLESSLQIFIDEFREHRTSGVIDIIYAHEPMPKLVRLDDIFGVGRNRFVVGKTRASEIKVSFREVPHLLIAGQTGSGKSTFLRSLITTLYLNDARCKFDLVDLKGGLEFQLFENLPRIAVAPDVPYAINALQRLEVRLKERMALLKEKGCKDIDAYVKQENVAPLDRHYLVVDEAAEMFLAGHHAPMSSIQTARRILSQIARQGRSVGVHLIIATQRPDAKALDPQVKANLTGVVCFQMLNDASSITVLGNGRATDLAPIPGRAIWKSGSEFVEVQTPYLETADVDRYLEKLRVAPENLAPVNSVQTTEANAHPPDAPLIADVENAEDRK